MIPREGSYLGLSASGFHRLAYTEWGAPAAERTVVCVHGLTRNGRDFDVLASSLAEQGFRVVCPDVVGRGRSDHLADPAGYAYPQYLADVNALIARLDIAELDWVGTSMGGLMGMMLAAQPGTPIRRMVINDVGPFIPKAALQRIGDYLGDERIFPDIESVEAHLREIHAPFGDLSDLHWRHLTVHGITPAKGGFRLAYDPSIAIPFTKELEDIDLWPIWEAIDLPVLVLRGERSDLLLPETAAEMGSRGPGARVVEVPDCGHAPALMTAPQIALVESWLTG